MFPDIMLIEFAAWSPKEGKGKEEGGGNPFLKTQSIDFLSTVQNECEVYRADN